jgi:predicted DNA-binding transcriptional regulator YafY
MNRTDRLTGIILALQNRRQTAAQLAARFEVSRRTILRDIDALSQIGVPIVAIPGAGGGLELPDNYWLKPVQLTSAEASALLFSAQAVSSHPDGPMAVPARSAVEKLRAALRPDVLSVADQSLGRIHTAAPRRADRLGHFQAVHDATAAGTWLRIDYQSRRRTAQHVLLPLAQIESDGFWYCSAVSYETRSKRQYRLDRIVAVEHVRPPADAEEVVREASAPGRAYDDPSHPEVVVTLDYQGARMAEDLAHYGNHVRQIDGTAWELRFRCPPSELDFCARTFFSFGPHAHVTAPPELRGMIRALLESTAEIYRDATEHGDAPLSPFGR